MSVQRIARLCVLLSLGPLTLALAGCGLYGGPTALSGGISVPGGSSSAGGGSTTAGGGSGHGSATAKAGLGGAVYGGQQPITGAAVTLWAAGTTGSYGTGATSVATTTTDSNGNFSFNSGGVSPCTTGQYLYITSVGGNPGAGTNQYAALMAATDASGRSIQSI